VNCPNGIKIDEQRWYPAFADWFVENSNEGGIVGHDSENKYNHPQFICVEAFDRSK
jgi:hypothetical protein